MKNAIRIRFLLIVMALVAPDWARAQQGGFMWPVSVAGGPAAGNIGIVVSENARHRITVFDRNDALFARFGAQGSGGSVGGSGSRDGEFNNPVGVAVDSQGFVYVADMGNSRIQKFQPSTGSFVTKWGSPGSGPGQFRKPRAIAVDAQGNVSVLDSQTGRIQKFSPDGTRHLGSWGGSLGTGDGQFSPAGGGPADRYRCDGLRLCLRSGEPSSPKVGIVSDATGTIQSATFEGWRGGCTSGANCNVPLEQSNGFTCTATTCSSPVPGSGDGQFLVTGNGARRCRYLVRDRYRQPSCPAIQHQYRPISPRWGVRG